MQDVIGQTAYLYGTDAVVYTALFMSKYYHWSITMQISKVPTVILKLAENEILFRSIVFICTNGIKQGSNNNMLNLLELAKFEKRRLVSLSVCVSLCLYVCVCLFLSVCMFLFVSFYEYI